MNYRKTLYYLLLPSLIIESLIFITSFYCQSSYLQWLCATTLNLNFILEPLGFGLLSIIPLLIVLLFTKKQVFTTWKKFAIPYIILSAIFLAIPDGGSGGFMGGGPDNEFFAIALSLLFFITSLLIIGIKSWKLRK